MSSKIILQNKTISHAKRQIFKENRSSRPKVFQKKGVLRNFLKLTGKHLCQSLFFNNVADLRPAILLKKETLHRWFPANFAKFLRTHFLIENLQWLLLRAPNFVSVSQCVLCTIQNASNSLAKTHLRIPFLQKSSQWLLPVTAFKCQLFF